MEQKSKERAFVGFPQDPGSTPVRRGSTECVTASHASSLSNEKEWIRGGHTHEGELICDVHLGKKKSSRLGVHPLGFFVFKLRMKGIGRHDPIRDGERRKGEKI